MRQLAREALATYEQLYGQDHGEIVNPLLKLGWTLLIQNDPESATPLFERSADLANRHLGPDHALTAIALMAWGQGLTDLGELDLAETKLQESAALLEHITPPGHWLRVCADSALGVCYARRGRFDDAEQLLVDSYERAVEQRGPEAPVAQRSRRALIALYEQAGRNSAAEQWRALNGHQSNDQ